MLRKPKALSDAAKKIFLQGAADNRPVLPALRNSGILTAFQRHALAADHNGGQAIRSMQIHGPFEREKDTFHIPIHNVIRVPTRNVEERRFSAASVT